MLALSVCPSRGSQLPQRGSQGVRQFRYAILQLCVKDYYSGGRNYFEQALEICWATVQLGS